MSPPDRKLDLPSQPGPIQYDHFPDNDEVAMNSAGPTAGPLATTANPPKLDPAPENGSIRRQSLAAQKIVTVANDGEVQANQKDGADGNSSVARLELAASPTTTTATHYLSVESKTYMDPAPPSLATSSLFPSRKQAGGSRIKHSHSREPSPTQSEMGYDERRCASEDEQGNDARSEIQSIMEQFSEYGGGPGADEVMSPRLEIASPLLLNPMQHPPRKSSLAPLAPILAQQLHDMQGLRISTGSPVSMPSKEREIGDQGPPVPPKDVSSSSGTCTRSSDQVSASGVPRSPTVSLHRPPPPEPEPDLAFNFHRFLEQLRSKKADPVARYLKSFLAEFGKRPWMVHEQVKIIGDFLSFISNKMEQCDVWREVSDAEFDNAREGMEKLVMNRLHTQTFSPAIAPPQPVPSSNTRKRSGVLPTGPGRRGQHQEDVEKDEVLAQKINIYGWVREEHLDIPPVGESGKRFLKLAQQELLKVKSYRAPRDKIICVLNCCKVIVGLLKHTVLDSSADSFIPMLIYVVLHANPEHLVSNVQYILRFRNQDKLGGEAGYYLSSLMAAIQFIENMDRTALTITDHEFEANVEAAVSAIAEKKEDMPPVSPIEKSSSMLQPPIPADASTSKPSSIDLDAASVRPATSGQSFSGNQPGGEEKAAITGLLRTIQKPLSTIGRIFSEDATMSLSSSSSSAAAPDKRPTSAARTPQPQQCSTDGDGEDQHPRGRQRQRRWSRLTTEEEAARQVSAEAAETQRPSWTEHATVVETLAGMFPDLDRDIISDVVYQKEGRVGLAVDACLALSA